MLILSVGLTLAAAAALAALANAKRVAAQKQLAPVRVRANQK